jgi:hypothetical protein
MPHLLCIVRGKREQILLHCIPAPLQVMCLKVINLAKDLAWSGIARALPHVIVRVAAAISHAPGTK